LRVVAVAAGGVSFGIAVPTVLMLCSRMGRQYKLVARGFLAVHLFVVVYVAATLAYFLGEDLTWRAPLALVIYVVKIMVLILLRDLELARRRRVDPPARRATD
jgi:hypothetical protein